MDTFCTSQPPATAIPVFFTSPVFSLSSRLGSTAAAWPGLARPCLASRRRPGQASQACPSQAQPYVCRSLSIFFALFHFFSLLAAWAADLVFVPGPARPGPGQARPGQALSVGAYPLFSTFPLFFTFGRPGRRPSLRPWPGPARPALSVGAYPLFFTFPLFFTLGQQAKKK